MTPDVKLKYEKAMDFFAAGRTAEAEEALRVIVSQHPSYWDAYETLGMVYYKIGKLDEAIACTETLVKLRPGYAMAHTNLSIFYMKKGLKEKAEEEKAKATVLQFSKGRADV